MRVYGGAVSPRGTDRADGTRPTHSPTLFIQQLGLAYRASGRTRPIMDAYVQHVYADNSSQSPTVAHPNSTSIGVADYPKLVALLGEAFDGTAQPGSTLPIVYGEFGVESQIPASKSALYTGDEPTTTKPVDEATQATYYRQALAMAFCQPTVSDILLFLTRDEQSRPGWQSGIYYVDGTPKASKTAVTAALNRATGGSIAHCPGVELPVHATSVRFGTRSAAKRGVFRVSFGCDLDCRYWVRLENASTHATKLAAKGATIVGAPVKVDLGKRHLAAGIIPLHPATRASRGPRPADGADRADVPSALARVAVLRAPHADQHVRAESQHDDEGKGVAARRKAVSDREPDRQDCEADGGVEEPPVPLRPGLEVAAPLAPHEEEEESDREVERDPQDAAHRCDDRFEREHDDDEGDRRNDRDAARSAGTLSQSRLTAHPS